MRIETIEIRNYRLFRAAKLDNLPPLSVLVGANGSGKSTLFDVFTFLKDTLTLNVAQAVGRRGGFKELVSRGADGPIGITVKFRESGDRLATYSLDIANDGGRPVVDREVLTFRRGQVFISTHSPEFLNGTRLEEIYWLIKRGGYTTIQRAGDNTTLQRLVDAGDPGSVWSHASVWSLARVRSSGRAASAIRAARVSFKWRATSCERPNVRGPGLACSAPMKADGPAGRRRGTLRFVDVETARAARGLRLVLLAGIPSPWSDGARALFAVKGIDVLAVRYLPGDATVTTWTGVPNAPAAVLDDDDRALSGWAEIVALGERLAPTRPLVPPRAADRARMFGLMHEILDEDGLSWSRRLLVLHESFRPDDPERPRCGFPLPLAQGLARRYGYAPDRIAAARSRLIDVLHPLDAELRQGHDGLRGAAAGPYYFGARLTALDLYAASAVAALVPPPDTLRPIVPGLRPIFEYLDPAVAAAVTPALRAHRDLVHERHLRDAPTPAPPSRS